MLTQNTDQPVFLCTLLRGAFFLIFICLSVVGYANTFQSTSFYISVAQRSETNLDKAQYYRSYQSTIYEPFVESLTDPSDNPSDAPSQISNRRNAWGGGGMGDEEGDDAGHRDPNSPIGEPWIMLIMAAIAAIVAKKRKTEQA